VNEQCQENISNAARIFMQSQEQAYHDRIFELSMQLDLSEEEVESVWGDSI
jgi:ubiquitin-protein ligase